jgi:hypothetical protein
MIVPAYRKTLKLAGLLVGLFTVASPSSAKEATYCVTCTGPDQTYLCRVDAEGAKASDALKLYCVIRTAKEGRHASCSAVHGSSCNGIEKVYSYDGPLPEDIASDPRVQKLQKKLKQENKAFEKPGETDTLVGLTSRAVRNARDRLGGSSEPAGQPLPQKPLPQRETQAPPSSQNAQATVPETEAADSEPGFARRSSRCMMSLFRNCSGEGAEGN